MVRNTWERNTGCFNPVVPIVPFKCKCFKYAHPRTVPHVPSQFLLFASMLLRLWAILKTINCTPAFSTAAWFHVAFTHKYDNTGLEVALCPSCSAEQPGPKGTKPSLRGEGVSWLFVPLPTSAGRISVASLLDASHTLPATGSLLVPS